MVNRNIRKLACICIATILFAGSAVAAGSPGHHHHSGGGGGSSRSHSSVSPSRFRSNTGIIAKQDAQGIGPGFQIPTDEQNNDQINNENQSNVSTTTRPETNGAWNVKADGTWEFKKADGTKYQNSWVVSGARWYYIGADGSMKTGWQQLNGKWYFFNPASANGQPAGSCFLNRTTPDGHSVDANGEWIH